MPPTTQSAGPLERLLVAVGAVPMAIEPYLPTAVRRNFGVRLFVIAFISVVGAPALSVVLFADVLSAAAFISLVVAVTGFLGYCEMYRALREINGSVRKIDAGEFDLDLADDRIDEIGETYGGLLSAAASLDETLREAEAAREE
ncbi:DUF2892 domain-containing protein, partial [Halapricum sp. CBA1109]|nr:DUF2892 domain-containing protein [Halapricum sp. CBA1109]